MRQYITPDNINLKSFDIKKELTPKIWVNNKLKENVRKRLLKIANDFLDTTGIDFVPVDIVLVGSITGFNWSKYSDIDLHIIADFSKLNDDIELIKNYFMAKKCLWNDKHKDLSIYNYDVELYVQDIHEENASNGVYSIKYNQWIKIPTSIHASLKKDIIKKLAAFYINKINYYNNKFDKLKSNHSFLLLESKVNYLYDLIVKGRKTSLAKEGEQAAGNIIFKVLRRSGHLGILNDLKRKLFDKINSIEETYKIDNKFLIINS